MTYNSSDDRLLFAILEKIENNIVELRETAVKQGETNTKLNERILLAEISIKNVEKELKILCQNKNRYNYFNTLTADNTKKLKLVNKVGKWISITLLMVIAVETFIAYKTGLIEIIAERLFKVFF